MTDTTHFLTQAAICDQLAAATSDGEERARFELLAQRWREVAARQEAFDARLEGDLVWALPSDRSALTPSASQGSC